MLDERNKEQNFTRLKIGNAVLTRHLPFPLLLVGEIALIVKLLKVLRLHAWHWPDLGGGSHLQHLQRPLLGNLLGGGARVLALTHQVELFFRSRI